METKDNTRKFLDPLILTVETYDNVKGKHPEFLCLFRADAGYITMKEDAENASRILGVPFSANPCKEKGEPESVLLFDYKELDVYLPKLIHADMRIAICDLGVRWKFNNK